MNTFNIVLLALSFDVGPNCLPVRIGRFSDHLVYSSFYGVNVDFFKLVSE